MASRPLITLVLTFIVASSATGECGTAPWHSTFDMVSVCTLEKPCVAGKPTTFELRADTSCSYASAQRCAPYKIDECDTIEYWFSDGEKVTVKGSNRVEHTFPASQAGLITFRATLRNDVSATVSGTGWALLAQDPPAYIKWAVDEITVPENAGEVTVDLVRTGDFTRHVSLSLRGAPEMRVVKDQPLLGRTLEFPAGTERASRHALPVRRRCVSRRHQESGVALPVSTQRHRQRNARRLRGRHEPQRLSVR